MKPLKHFTFFDRLGIVLSTLCIIHCALTPFIFLIPSITSIFPAGHSDQFHQFILAPVIITAVLSFIPAYLKTNNWKLLALAILGGLCLFFAHEMQQPLEAILSISGGSFLISAHYSNIRHSRCCLGH
jgi:accessory gene regulator protein AgrB